jgi:hypothetical protein
MAETETDQTISLLQKVMLDRRQASIAANVRYSEVEGTVVIKEYVLVIPGVGISAEPFKRLYRVAAAIKDSGDGQRGRLFGETANVGFVASPLSSASQAWRIVWWLPLPVSANLAAAAFRDRAWGASATGLEAKNCTPMQRLFAAVF